MRKILFSVALVFSLIVGVNAQTRPIAHLKNSPSKELPSAGNQESITVHPTVTKTALDFKVTIPLRDMAPSQGPLSPEQMEANHEIKEQHEAGHGDRANTTYPYAATALPQDGDAVAQRLMGQVQMNLSHAPLVNFEGQSSPYYPSDVNGAAGPNYYMQGVNSTYAIYDKTGAQVVAPTDFNTLFNGVTGASNNDGDIIVMYDEDADRWFVAEFSISGSNDYMLMAVSTTNDPTGTWNAYSFDVDDMPDYMKFGIWSDGYYMGDNNSSSGKNDIYVFERSVMIAGGSNPQMVAFDNPNRPNSGFNCIMPLDNDGPNLAPAGTPGQFIAINDDAWGGSDQLWIYELSVDWGTLSNSTFQRTQQLAVSAFDSAVGSGMDDISQPGTSQKLDAIDEILMFRAQYRNFGSTQSIVCAHTVDENGSGHAGIRWYELQNTGSGWSVRQQGTYAPDADNRFQPSIAMDANHNIGLGYTVSGGSTYPSIRYCGQSSTENANASGVLDIAEESIYEGTAAQTANNRWGDYCELTLDPSDDVTFWFTNEYINSGKKTKIASFMFAPSTAKPNTNFQVNTPSTLLRPVPILEGDIVTYTDLTTGDVDSYTWTFDGGTPGTASTQDPGNITYNTTGLYDVTLLAHHNTNGDSTLTKTNLIDVLDPATETCKTVSQYYGNAALYGTSGGGYFSGTNEYNFTKLSDKFENYTPYNKLTGTRIYWGQVTNGTSPDVTFAVWQDNGSGIPGTLLESKDVPLATVLNDYTTNGYSDIVFDNEVFLPAGAFYVGVIMPNDGSNGDTLAIITNTDADGPDNTAYLEYNGTWESYFDATGSLTLMHAIFPTLCYVPNPPPVADFVADQTNITAGTTVNFTDQSANNPASWAWDFGDGNTSTQQNPSNTYASDGLYTVSLTATKAGVSDTKTKTSYIIVDSQTYCASTYTQSGSEYISNVTFNTINNSSGDAATDGYEDFTTISTTVNPDATYALSVTVNTAGNYTDYIEAYFDWNDDGDFADAGEMVDLGTQQNQTAGVATANVTVPTGASLSAIRMRINIEYNNAPGPCDADHSSEWGETEDYTIIVNTPTPAPVADFTGTPLTICPGESVTFTDASTNTPTAWAWNFGDTQTDNVQNPTHTYTTAGTYTVSLTASNAGGSDTKTITNYVTVNATTAITTQPTGTTACVGDNVTFTVVATGSNLSYQWKKGTTNVGTDNASYTITGVASADAADYTCVVSGDCGNVTSNAATLIVNPTTAITTQPTGTTACVGDNVTFTVVATGSNLSYQWKKGTTNVGTDNASYTITGVASADAADYTCVVSGDCGNVTSNAATLTVNPTTVITSQPTGTTACVGDNVTFTVVATGSNLSYQWKKGTTNVGTNNASYTITGVVSADAADYTCLVSGDCGNVTSNTATLTVNPTAVAPSSVSASSSTICEGESTTLTYQAGSGDTFNWYSGSCGGSLVGSGNNLSVSPTSTTTYYGRWESSCGNSTCQSVTVTVNTVPSLSMSATNASCGNTDGTATVSATGGTGSYSYLWDDASAQATATASNLAQGTYNVTVTSGACTATGNATVNEDGAPTVSVSASQSTICEGETTVLTASGADSYSWSPATDLDATTGITVNASPTADIMYTVTGTTAGCSASANVSITVNPITVITSQPISTTVCEGDNITFTVTATGSNLSYQWKKGTTNVGTDNASYTITGVVSADAADYTCVLSGACGNVTSNAATLTVNPTTVITSQPTSSTVCEGDNVTFSVTATGSNLSYQWKKGTTNVGADNASYTITGVASADAADYTCVVTGDCGTVTSNAATLTVNPTAVAPSSVSASSSTICEGESTTLTYQAGSGDTFNWYSGSCGGSLVGSGNNLSVSPTSTTTYYGRWESSCGNSTCESVTVTVNTIPSLSMSATNASCGNTDGTATVSATGGTGSYSYLWDDPSAQATATASNLGQGVYNVTVTSGACSATGNATVNEDGAPTVSVSASQTTICEGQTTVLTASGADSYSWSPATDLDATTGTTVNASPTADIMYTVTGTTAGCSASANVSITVNHTPVVSFTVDNSAEPVINFTNTTTGADSYSWDLGDGTIETTTDVSHEYTSNNTYTVILSATNGCGTENYQQVVTITNIGIVSLDKESIQVYPNPAKSILNIDLPIKDIDIVLVDMNGKIIKTIESKDAKHLEIDVEDIATGLYNLIMTTQDNHQVIVKVVKQ